MLKNMVLTLQETTQPTPQYATAQAAFFSGDSAYNWLAELSRLGVSATAIDGYLLPESSQSRQAAGLFVVFKKTQSIDFEQLKSPYVCVSEGLYAPLSTRLFPPVSEAEFKRLLIWDVQVFHPHIGFVGFKKTDKIDFTQLISLGNPSETEWHHAQTGVPFRPPLTDILMKPVSFQDVLSSINDTVERKPLSDIPKPADEPTDLEKLLDDMKRGFLKGSLSALDKLAEMFPNTEGPYQNYDGPNLSNWLQKKLNDLEKKRNEEINRLLNLFDKDPNEALKYALPLDSPYFNRGEAPPSDSLGRRSTDFNLNNLGGGRSVDGWDLGEHFYTLQDRYRKAAEAAIARGDYKKAAYVYAHLLGDFQSAAQVLEQGKYYQEAAVLYKDHLKNLPAAASCLERGGLIKQAIDLYDELKSYEKVGDLYEKIEQPTKAKRYYEASIDTHAERSDFMEMARIEGDKLKEKDRAMATLLRGWAKSNQEEKCLQQYFDKTKNNAPETLPDAVQSVYDHHTPKHKRVTLLGILADMVRHNKAADFRQTTRDIAYDILAEDVAAGNVAALHQLKKFLPDDRLINADLNVFKRHFKPVETDPSVPPSFQLDNTIKWLAATCHRNQYIALGLKDNQLQMARGNWYGNFEYHSWTNIFEEEPSCRFLLNQYASESILVWLDETTHLSVKKLEKNKYFDSQLMVGNSHFVTKLADSFGAILLHDGSVAKWVEQYNRFEITSLNEVGMPQGAQPYTFSPLFMQLGSIQVAEMFHKHKQYFSYKSSIIFSIAPETHLTRELDLDNLIIKMTMPTESPNFGMAIITYDSGCLLIQSDFENQTVRDVDFFAADIKPIDLKFINDNTLVVMGLYAIRIYDVRDNAAYHSKFYLHDHQKAVAILATNNRHEFAILGERGTITRYAI
jgi:tetratricopeptide (TPR) repeat protein